MRRRWLASLVSMTVACGRVSGIDQPADADLGGYTADNAADLRGGSIKTAELLVGNKDAAELVPATLEWEVASDPAGCLRIKHAGLRRNGGPTSVEIYDVRFKHDADRPCASRLDGKNELFETIHVLYCWRWNGASNDTPCAYSSALTLSADAVGVEGGDARAAASAP